MRKNSLSLSIVTACLLLVGCSNEADEPVNDSVIEAIENKEYDKALTLIEENADGSPDDEETKALYAQLQEFKEVKDTRDNADWDGVLEKAHPMLENASLESGLKAELEKMIVEAEMEINNSIKENAEQNSTGSKEKYLAKIAEVENGIKELDPVFENGTQIELTEAQVEVFERWDALLNEIYKQLETQQLSPNDMNKLREEQRKWLTHRDEKAAEAASKFEGGSMKNLEYASVQAQLTKERCYELVEKYMK
ncbi:DUF1311 domain-containing protein [Solibacillus sp. A46]|uniref:DUF1311 domain-containing protein n=1 Tax=Solibacillus faecavium TaxID=2762221 RepID=A0ABR8XXX6_9BACL|nr:lysozyme inhibitor LprI family protein [Solibacillus faecavium]MBD8036778.1 DUF1311 domain-containing protein [Solibacillus faecavium]